MLHLNSGLFAFVIVFGVSALATYALIKASERFPIIAGRNGDLGAVQAMHSSATPRVGGVGVLLAMLAASLFVPERLHGAYAQFLAASSLLFLAGLLEDLGYGVSPKLRLLAAVVSSALVILLFNAWAPRLGLPILDAMMAGGILGIPLTIFGVVGLANAFNLIDGVNGLAGFTAIVATVAMGAMAWTAGLTDITQLLALFSLAIAGFLCFNYPRGRIFLGDSGAYTLGFVLAWFGLAIVLMNPAVSVWAVLMTVFWPIIDTLLAIYRRLTLKKPAMQPDRLHVHQLVLRTLESHILGRGKRHLANPLTTLILAPYVVMPAFVGVLLWDQTLASFVAFVGAILVYFAGYFYAVRLVGNGALRKRRA